MEEGTRPPLRQSRMRLIASRLGTRFKRRRREQIGNTHRMSNTWHQPPRTSTASHHRSSSRTSTRTPELAESNQAREPEISSLNDPIGRPPTAVNSRRKLITKLQRLSQQIRSPRRLGASIRQALKQLMPNSKSRTSSLGFNIKNIFRFGRPRISLSFTETSANGEIVTSTSTTKVFSTYDEIHGTVTVLAKADCKIDELEIAMTGVARTFVDKLSNSSAVTGRSEAIHRFLKLIQPVYDEELPPGKMLSKGKTYQFPFTFVVPANLMPRACIHSVTGPHIKELHLMLPPSLGERGSGDGASEQSKINYKIHAKVIRNKSSTKKVTLSEVAQTIRIRPANDEMPPLNVEGDNTYCLRSEKTIRDGLLKGRNGTLIVEAMQPKAFRLKSDSTDRQSESGYVRLQLRFDPSVDTAIPPKLNSLATKLKVTTHFATTVRRDLPKKIITELTSDAVSDVYALSNYSVASVDWKQHKPGTDRHGSVVSFRRDSTTNFFASSNASVTSYDHEDQLKPSSSYRDGALYYTAQIAVPVSLPNLPNKQFLPTFHTCLISRTYLLQLSLSLSGSLLALPLKLVVPVQVVAEGSIAGAERARLAAVAEQAVLEANMAFEPRYIGPGLEISDGSNMSAAARQHAVDSYSDHPPGYETPGFVFRGGSRPMYS